MIMWKQRHLSKWSVISCFMFFLSLSSSQYSAWRRKKRSDDSIKLCIQSSNRWLFLCALILHWKWKKKSIAFLLTNGRFFFPHLFTSESSNKCEKISIRIGKIEITHTYALSASLPNWKWKLSDWKPMLYHYIDIIMLVFPRNARADDIQIHFPQTIENNQYICIP